MKKLSFATLTLIVSVFLFSCSKNNDDNGIKTVNPVPESGDFLFSLAAFDGDIAMLWSEEPTTWQKLNNIELSNSSGNYSYSDGVLSFKNTDPGSNLLYSSDFESWSEIDLATSQLGFADVNDLVHGNGQFVYTSSNSLQIHFLNKDGLEQSQTLTDIKVVPKDLTYTNGVFFGIAEFPICLTATDHENIRVTAFNGDNISTNSGLTEIHKTGQYLWAYNQKYIYRIDTANIDNESDLVFEEIKIDTNTIMPDQNIYIFHVGQFDDKIIVFGEYEKYDSVNDKWDYIDAINISDDHGTTWTTHEPEGLNQSLVDHTEGYNSGSVQYLKGVGGNAILLLAPGSEESRFYYYQTSNGYQYTFLEKSSSYENVPAYESALRRSILIQR